MFFLHLAFLAKICFLISQNLSVTTRYGYVLSKLTSSVISYMYTWKMSSCIRFLPYIRFNYKKDRELRLCVWGDCEGGREAAAANGAQEFINDDGCLILGENWTVGAVLINDTGLMRFLLIHFLTQPLCLFINKYTRLALDKPRVREFLKFILICVKIFEH